MITRNKRNGFTLVELLVVMLIILLISAVALPAMIASYWEMGVKSSVGTLKAALENARDRAQNAGADSVVGVRLIPNTTLSPLSYTDFGTIDPETSLTYSRIVTLRQPPNYTEGLVTHDTSGYPTSFTNLGLPPFRRLVVEEALGDGNPYTDDKGVYHPEGQRAVPTNWWWNVRVGDKMILGGQNFTVCGPVLVDADTGQNSERYVNMGLPGQFTSPLMRPFGNGQAPVEFLFLVNSVDDDGDGFANSGWDGIDNDLDSAAGASANGRPDVPTAGWTKGVDEDDEWEPESFPSTLASGFTALKYTIVRRPVPRVQESVELASSTAIDATGWTNVPVYYQTTSWTDRLGSEHAKAGWDYTLLRSKLPVNPFTGEVDLILNGTGGWTSPTSYGVPFQTRKGDEFIHFWIANNSDVAYPPLPKGTATILSLNQNTGKITVGDADPTDVEGTFARAEGRQ